MRNIVFSSGDHPLLTILSIGYADTVNHPHPEKIYYPSGKRMEYIFQYVLEGSLVLNGSTVTQGQGFLLTPGMEHTYSVINEDKYAALWFVVEDPKAEALLSYFNATPETGIFCSPPNEIFTPIIQKLKNVRSSICPASLMLELFLSVFHEHLKINTPHPPTSNADIYVDTAAQYIDSHIHNKITVEEITRFLGVTQPYLFNIFKERYNLSPKQYIDNRKIAYAQNLLQDTTLPIWQVAEKVGFEDAFHFSKFFSRHTGVAPSRFRQKEQTTLE